MEALLDLDDRAFDARYGELHDDLLRVCRSVGAGSDAEDIAQDVLIFARGRVSQLRDDAKLKPWLRRIAVRWTQRRLNGPAADPNTADLQWTTADLELHLDEREALNALSRRQRQLIALVYVAGFRQEEAAEMLGISRGTVARTLWDARCALALRLADYRTHRE